MKSADCSYGGKRMAVGVQIRRWQFGVGAAVDLIDGKEDIVVTASAAKTCRGATTQGGSARGPALIGVAIQIWRGENLELATT